MKQYNYFQAMVMSFYSRNLYRDVINNWGAGVVLYLFLLLAICWAITIVRVQPMINKSFSQFISKFSEQIPPISIKNGVVHTPENKPYLLRDPDNKSVFGIIDTSGQYKNLEDSPTGTQIVVTSDKIYYKDKEDAIKIQTIPSNLNYDIKPHEAKSTLITIVSWGWIILYPVLLLVSFVYRLIQALIYAVLGKIFSLLGNISLSYSTILKLSIITLTPAIVISTIFDVFGIHFKFEWLFYFVLTMFYLTFALGAGRNTDIAKPNQ